MKWDNAMWNIKNFFLVLCIWSCSLLPSTVGQTVAGYSLAIQSDQKSVLVGSAANNGTSSIVVVRYNTDGTIDTSYGQEGVVLVTIANASNQYGQALVLQSDDKALVAGNCIIDGVSSSVIVRLNTDGTLDREFGNNGVVIFTLDQSTSAASIALQSDNKIIIGGAYISSVSEILIARFNTDGSLDSTFGTSSGYTLTNLDNNIVISDMRLQSTQKIVVSGTMQGNHFMARYTTQGLLDTTFGSNGDGTVNTSLDNVGIMYALGINASDELYAGGYEINQGLILKYSAEGILDTDFADSGYFLFSSGPLAFVFSLYPLTSAVLFSGSSGGIAMVGKVLDTGVFDSLFGTGGIMRLTQGIEDSIAYSMQEQNDGKFLAGGVLCNGCLVFRFDATGALDNTFNGTGYTNDPSGDPCTGTPTV